MRKRKGRCSDAPEAAIARRDVRVEARGAGLYRLKLSGEGRNLLIAACDVAARGRLIETAEPLKRLIDRIEGDDPRNRGQVRSRDDDVIALRARRAMEAIDRSGFSSP